MRKIISSILVLTMVLSLFSFTVSAAHWADDAISYVTENGYWIASTPLEPDRVATRAETASLFARILISKIPAYNGAYTDVSHDNIYAGDITAVTLMGLMQGYDGEFRPNDTLTREELACILDRAAKMVSDEFVDREYIMEYYKDGENVSDWARQSVENASFYVLMKGKGEKAFDPQGTTTLAEVATVVKSLADLSALQSAVTTTHTVRDISSSDNITKDFSVIQSGGTYSHNNIGGYGMMVRFDGTPGNIYVQRNHPESASLQGFAHPVVVARVIDPNGDMIARVNMSYKEFGTMEKIINIPNGQPGIYRIEFTGGSNGDICTIGVNNPVSWGVYGMSTFNFTSTTPKTSYFWAPWKCSNLSLGVTYGEGVVYTADGETRVASTGKSTNATVKRVELTTLAADTVYSLVVSDGFAGAVGMLGGSRVLCPTAEMAADLKGGYIWYEDEYGAFQYRGPLQVRARKRMIEIYEEMDGNFDVEFEIPQLKAKEEYDNLMAEGMLYAKYYGAIQGVEGALYKQILDPSNVWFGNFVENVAMIEGTTPYPTPTWEEGFYAGGGGLKGRNAFVGALTINAETNAFYAHPVIQKRVELMYLARIVQQEAEGLNFHYDAKGRAANTNGHGAENFDWGEQDTATSYRHARNFLSPQTRIITDNGMIQHGDWVKSHRGQGATNQGLMCMEGSLETYLWTLDETYLQQYEASAAGAAYPAAMTAYIGQPSPLGYFNEGSSSDGGSYGAMSDSMWHFSVMEYLTEVPEEKRDPEKMAKILDATNRNLLWNSIWFEPSINGFEAYRPNVYTGRTDPPYGGSSTHGSFYYLQTIYPIAKRMTQVNIAGSGNPFTHDVYKWMRTSGVQGINEVQAYNLLKEELASRENYIGVKTDGLSDVANSFYKVHHLPQEFEDSEIERLPFELLGDYNVIDPEGGAIAIKHKGLYMTSFYNNDIAPKMSGGMFLTAAPCQVFDEYFGTVFCSMKPFDWKARINLEGGAANTAMDYRGKITENDVYHTGIIGKDDTGALYAEGKGFGNLKWFDDKSFEIRGTDPFNSRDYVWQYYMTDEGIELKAGMDSIRARDNLWVQLAVVDPSVSVAEAQLIHEGNTLTWKHEDKTLTLTWDESVESQLITKPNAAAAYKFLQLKLTPEKPMISIKFTRNVGDYVFNSGIEYNFQ